MNIKRLLTLALVALAVVAALAVLIPDHETGDLGGTSWTLVAYGPVGAPVAAQAPANIAFEANGRFGGFTGCNHFFGNYRATNGRWEIIDGEIAMTVVDCATDAPEGAQDAFFGQHLIDGNYTITADRLTLYFANGQMAEYDRTA